MQEGREKVKAQSVPKEGLVCIEILPAVISPVSVITQTGNTEVEVLSARADVPWQITKQLARVPRSSQPRRPSSSSSPQHFDPGAEVIVLDSSYVNHLRDYIKATYKKHRRSPIAPLPVKFIGVSGLRLSNLERLMSKSLSPSSRGVLVIQAGGNGFGCL